MRQDSRDFTWFPLFPPVKGLIVTHMDKPIEPLTIRPHRAVALLPVLLIITISFAAITRVHAQPGDNEAGRRARSHYERAAKLATQARRIPCTGTIEDASWIGARREAIFHQAIEAYRACADEPADDWRPPECGFRAAKLLDDRLARPREAIESYRAYLEKHPTHRNAGYARDRVRALQTQLGGGELPLARFTAAKSCFPYRDRGLTIRMMRKIARDHPEFPLRTDVLFWLISQYRRQQAQGARAEIPEDLGLGLIDELILLYPAEAKEHWQAMLRRGETLRALGRFGEARRQFMEVARTAPETLGFRESGRDRWLRATAEMIQRSAFWMSWVLVLAGLLFALWLVWGCRRRGHLRVRPTGRVLWLIPLFALPALLTLTPPFQAASAVLPALLWLSGIGYLLVLTAPPLLAGVRTRVGRALAAIGVALFALSCAYLVLHYNNLVVFVAYDITGV